MFVKKTLAATGLLAVAGAMAACGGSSSSTPTGAAGAPTGATTADFCSTVQNLASSSNATPKDVADQLQAVGTPSDISASERHGFEVFVDKLETLSASAKASDLQQGLSATDLKDVTAFETYVQGACVPGTSSTPSAPSS
jgi:hypothetical protein